MIDGESWGIFSVALGRGKNINKFFDIIFNKDNFLYSEPKFLLQEEINDLSRYFSILNSIALGNTK